MGWIRIDDCLPDHPRVSEALPEAMWLYVAGMCYCNRLKTDGKIPKTQIARLTSLAKPERLTASLIEVGLWIDAGKEVEVFNYLKFQRSASERDEVSQRNASNGRSGGLAKAKRVARELPEPHASERLAEKEKEKEEEKATLLKATSQASPDDISDPEHPDFFDAVFWPNYPCQNWPAQPNPKPGKAEAKAQWSRLDRADKRLAGTSLPHYKAYLELTGQQTKHCERYLRQKAFYAYQQPPTAAPGPSATGPPKGKNARNFDAVIQRLGVNDGTSSSASDHQVPQRGLPAGRMEPGEIRALG